MSYLVIPGEKITKYQKQWTIPLKQYRLEESFMTLFKHGIEKLSTATNGKHQQTAEYIKSCINQESPTESLTPQTYTKLLHLLLMLEEYQMGVNIRQYDTDCVLKRAGHLFKLDVPELAEHRPSLVIGDSVYVKVNDKILYEGVVHRTELDSVYLQFNSKFKKVFIPGNTYRISFGINRTTLKLEHRAVDMVTPDFIDRIAFPSKISVDQTLEDEQLDWFNTNIGDNRQQQKAIKHILENTSKPAPYIIYGPPGTGKTMTIVEAVMQIWKTQNSKRVLVCTPSNNAANEINRRLIAIPRTDLLRYVSYTFPFKEIPVEVRPYCNYDTAGEYYNPTIDFVRKKRVVVATLTTAGRLISDGIGNDHFDYIIIDESGHATETETLIPLTGLANPNNTQIVLAGDPKQLGPVIHSYVATKYGFGASMMERLMNDIPIYKKSDGFYNPNAITKLLVNYRSHKDIVKISNEEFYEDELICAEGHLAKIAIGYELLRNKSFPLMFHSVIGTDQRESNSPSFFNLDEVKVVFDYLQNLLGSRMKGMEITEEHIGVITPYRKQVQKIRKMCDKYKFNKIMVGSVEQIQGQERLIIIISTVRSKIEYLQHDYKFHLGFLKNPKRFNVAITRAKALVIVIGNPNLLQHDKYWNSYIRLCKAKYSLFGAAFDMKPPSRTDSFHSTHTHVSDISANFEKQDSVDEVDFSRGNI